MGGVPSAWVGIVDILILLVPSDGDARCYESLIHEICPAIVALHRMSAHMCQFYEFCIDFYPLRALCIIARSSC